MVITVLGNGNFGVKQRFFFFFNSSALTYGGMS